MRLAAEAMLEDLKRLLPEGMTLNGWAVAAGVNRAIWGDIRKHGNPSRRTLEKLLAAAGSSLAEFEALRIGAAVPPNEAGAERLAEHHGGGWRGAPLRPLALKTTLALGANEGLSKMRILGLSEETVARPASLAGDAAAYAIIIADDVMWPRFRAGRRLVIAPDTALREGDDVLVQLTSGEALVAELVVRDPDDWWLRQFMPDRTERVAVTEMAAAERVLGEAI